MITGRYGKSKVGRYMGVTDTTYIIAAMFCTSIQRSKAPALVYLFVDTGFGHFLLRFIFRIKKILSQIKQASGFGVSSI